MGVCWKWNDLLSKSARLNGRKYIIFPAKAGSFPSGGFIAETQPATGHLVCEDQLVANCLLPTTSNSQPVFLFPLNSHQNTQNPKHCFLNALNTLSPGRHNSLLVHVQQVGHVFVNPNGLGQWDEAFRIGWDLLRFVGTLEIFVCNYIDR